MKYSDPGGKVIVRTKSESGRVYFSVIDDGIGIADVAKDKIFDRFYQYENSRSDSGGLGLPIVKWITELHGGPIEVKSTLGEGSKFTVTFPCVQTDATHTT